MPTRCSVHILLDKTVTNKYLLTPPDMKCTAIWEIRVKCGEYMIQDNQEQVLPEASSADCVLSTSGDSNLRKGGGSFTCIDLISWKESYAIPATACL